MTSSVGLLVVDAFLALMAAGAFPWIVMGVIGMLEPGRVVLTA